MAYPPRGDGGPASQPERPERSVRPDQPDAPGQPDAPNSRQQWDATQWRPDAADPLNVLEPDPDDTPGVAAEQDGGHDEWSPDEARFLLVSQPPSWWTPQRFVIALTGFMVAILLGIGVLFWLSINAFEKQRSGDTVPQPTPTSVVIGPDQMGSVPD